MKRRLLSLLLTIVLIFSILPTSVYAGGGGGAGGQAGTKPTASTDGTWFAPAASNYQFMRFSLYFAETSATSLDEIRELESQGKLEYEQLGKTLNVRIKGTQPSNCKYFSSELSVFERMTPTSNPIDLQYAKFIEKNWFDLGVDVSEIDFSKTFPKVFDYSGSSQDTRWNEFFLGVDKVAEDGSNWETEVNLAQTMKVIDKIIEGEVYSISESDYKQGILKTDYGEKEGVYKFYFEPMAFFVLGKSNGSYQYYLMTARDAIAYYNTHSTKIFVGSKNGSTKNWTFDQAFSSLLKTLGGSVHLITDEPILGMTAIKGVNSSSLKPGGDFYKGGGLGVVIGFPHQGRQVKIPEVIKTYVMIDSIDENGNATYKKYQDSVKIPIGYWSYDPIDNAITPHVYILEYLEDDSVGVLNDIVTTSHIFTEFSEDQTEWVNSSLIQNKDNLIIYNDDITGYKFGLITDSSVFKGSALASSSKLLGDLVGELKDPKKFIKDEGDYFLNSLLFTSTKDKEISGALKYDVIKSGFGDGKDVYFKSGENRINMGYVDKSEGLNWMMVTEDVRKEYEQKGMSWVLPTNPSNTLILRYIVTPQPSQINIVKTYERKADGSEVLKDVKVEDKVLLDIDTDTKIATIKTPTTPTPKRADSDPTLMKWVTNGEYPIVDVSDGNLPSKVSKTGNEQGIITEYPTEPVPHNLFVEWKVVIPEEFEAEGGSEYVPEWRLSKHIDSIATLGGNTKYATMSFTLGRDKGHKTSSLSNSGNYNFDTVNANGRLNNDSADTNNQSMTTIGTVPTGLNGFYAGLGANTYFQSRTHTQDTDSISHSDTSAEIALDATLTMVKSNDNGGLVIASWIKDNKPDLMGYSITSNVLPTYYNQAKAYNRLADLRLGIYNRDTYTHQQGFKYDWTCHHSEHHGCHTVCDCYLSPEIFKPSSVGYTTANYQVNVGFDRYIQKDMPKLTVEPAKTAVNSLTTLKYQIGETIKVYPEYGMLFTDNAGQSSLRFVVSDKAREINPVVYQTLQHKVYVTPTSTGSSVATDTRALNKARTMGAGNKQVIYKGAAVNTNFAIGRAKGSSAKGIMTVKTFALDFKDKSKTNNVDVKTAWGNSGYNSYDEHKSLLNSITANSKASITEKLLIESTYTGGEKKATSKDYSLIKYNDNPNKVDGGNAVVFTHELIIRGGKLIGIRMMDRSSRQLSAPITIEQLKGKDEALYLALVNMNLYDATGNKANTVLASFEHKADNSAILAEQDYGEMLNAARAEIDGFADNSSVKINAGDKWYSEDTTVLVVKEYVSNFEVPSTAVSDKLPMTIPGLTNLATPTNKAQYFSQMGRGYTYLKYNLLNNHPYISGEKFNTFFEFSSNPSDGFDNGAQGLDYLVPNVSITDTMTLN